jgi:two-component system, OmpR family, sensor histidine kinase YxdK
MKLQWFLRDQWRVFVFFAVGYLLMFAVVWLASESKGFDIGRIDAGYAIVLGGVAFVSYLLVEHAVKRPFYVELEARLRTTDGLHSVTNQPAQTDGRRPEEFQPFSGPRGLSSHGELQLSSTLAQAATFQVYCSEEERLFLELLHNYHDSYLKSLQAIQSRQEFYEQFTLRFAHQMKTPVTVLQLLVQELEPGQDLQQARALSDETLHRVLEDMQEELRRLDESLGTMMQTARMTSFEFDARMEVVEAVAVIRDVINEHKVQWIRRGIFPRIQAHGQVYVTTDKKWFQFIVNQIVRNALQYGFKTDSAGNPLADPGPFVVTVRVDDQHHLCIDFTDHGIGITERDIRRVFDPFYTGSNGRTHSRATGMGLYLVSEICRRLGHKVSIASIEGEGTTVTLVLPSPDYHRPVKVDAVD